MIEVRGIIYGKADTLTAMIAAFQLTESYAFNDEFGRRATRYTMKEPWIEEGIEYMCDVLEFACVVSVWKGCPGEVRWNALCKFAERMDLYWELIMITEQVNTQTRRSSNSHKYLEARTIMVNHIEAIPQTIRPAAAL